MRAAVASRPWSLVLIALLVAVVPAAAAEPCAHRGHLDAL
jgi:hypothetical protein